SRVSSATTVRNFNGSEFGHIDPESLKFPPQLKAAMSVVDGAWDKAVKTTVIKGGWKALKGLWGRG
ncbi:hypothetical protein HDU76_011186, partial [Blyttiomyces sp. JEL0837]